MLTFEELYKKVVHSSKTKEVDKELDALHYDPYHLECILRPDLKPTEWNNGNDDCIRSIS